MKRALAIAAVLAVAPSAAHAFCGFYVEGSGKKLFADATQVVLMRMGTRTVLAMQNDYKGPPEAFAMVIPVPVVLHEGDVKTLKKDVFEKIEQMGAPRLVEYWEHDPCSPDYPDDDMPKGGGGRVYNMAPQESGAADHGVKIEAQFTVGEYQIVILSAKDSTGLDTWLKEQKYKIPDGAEPLLRPYVESGMKFFVAKVDPTKVKFDEQQRAALSPLRFHYDSDEFSLPIRLGLANSSGTQDLIVNILAPHQRYEVSNYKNVTIPTNIDVRDSVKPRFAEFYAALFDRTVEKNPGAVVTEYAWDASTCDPCPGPTLDQNDFATLGADVLAGTKDRPAPYEGYDLVLTRLHARYGKTITDDLRFKDAKPIVGGREHVVDSQTGRLEEGAKTDATNNFQGRYAIRHPWSGPIACDKPIRHRWGGPNNSDRPGAPQPATKLAFAQRGTVQLPQVVARDVPEIDVRAVGAAIGAPISFGDPNAKPDKPNTPAPTEPEPKKKTGCGCQGGLSTDSTGLLAAIGLGWLLHRRRRPRAVGGR